MSWVKRVDKSMIHPELLAAVEETLELLEVNGTPFKVYSGYRSFAEQEDLFARERVDQGNIVTNARGGQSMHNYGLAVDLAPLNLMTPQEWDIHWPDPDKSDSVWYALESCLERAGRFIAPDLGIEFEWGGRWKFRDVPHVQIRTTLRELQGGFYPPSANYSWMVQSHTGFLFDNPWIRRRVQYLLNASNCNAGPVDGIVGSRTRAAISQFMSENNLEGSDITRQFVKLLVEQTL